MDDPRVIAAIVGIFAAIAASVVAGWISHRRLREEILSQHRAELIKKQILACEALWSCLRSTSFTDSSSEERVVQGFYSSPYGSGAAAGSVADQINSVFHSEHGLYFSRSLRSELFNFRDYLTEAFIHPAVTNSDDSVRLTREELGEYQERITKLRNEIRNDLGTQDLQLASKGPV